MEKSLPKGQIYLLKDTGRVKIHTLVSPAPFFANATHIIELSSQLIVVDGHYFAQYGHELRALADSLAKPITRLYISHDHPDHYLGIGDAFSDTEVYALAQTKAAILAHGAHELADKQAKFGSLMASRIQFPTQEVAPGQEEIDGVIFHFDEILDAESPVALGIGLPEAGVYIAQDLVYNHTHLFISGSTIGWRKGLETLRNKAAYTVLLAGHGEPTDQSVIDRMLTYLNKVDQLLEQKPTPQSYKSALLTSFPDYAGEGLIDIYTSFLLAEVE